MADGEFRLDVLVEETDYGCISRARSSPVGPTSAPFELRVERRDLNKLQESLHSAVGADAFELTLLREELQVWGRRLFNALFHDDMLACYRASKKLADDAGKELRVHLDFSETPWLSTLPWEYLYDTERQEVLSLSAGTLFARYTGLMHHLRPPKLEMPLRTLVVIASPEGWPEIDVQRAWLSLLDEVDYLGRERKMVLEWLQKPTLLDLQRRLRGEEFHILHFIGHSALSSETGEGQLIFEDEMGRSRTISGEHLGSLLRDHFSLRLALLTGGREVRANERIDGTGGVGFLDVGQNLLKRGMGAVIATPFPLPSGDMTHFLAQLYADIADLSSIDWAVAHARTAIREERVWRGAPVLLTRLPDGNLFNNNLSQTDQLPPSAEENIAFRLNSLRIRTATPEAMARWSEELTETRIKRRFERD